MALTLKMMRSRVRYTLGLWKNEGYAVMPDDLLDHLANESQRNVRIDLQDRVENFTTTLTANQRTFTLPADFLKEYEIYVERDVTTGFQGYRLESRPYRDLVEIGSRFDKSSPRTGRVERYSISDDGLFYLDPLPSEGVRIDLFYMAVPSNMTSDGDTPDFAEIYHELVLCKLKEKVAQEIGNVGQFQNFFQIYQAMLGTYRPLARSRQSHSTQLIFSG